MPCVALSSPLHFHALVSLSSVFFLLITSHFIYDRTQENCFQVLICISWTLSLALLPLFLPSFPALIILPPSLSPSFLSGLCSAALRPCQRRNTPWYPSLLSEEYTTWDAQKRIFDISLYPFFPFSLCLFMWCKSTCVYVYHVIAVSCPPWGGKYIKLTSLVQKRLSERQEQIRHYNKHTNIKGTCVNVSLCLHSTGQFICWKMLHSIWYELICKKICMLIWRFGLLQVGGKVNPCQRYFWKVKKRCSFYWGYGYMWLYPFSTFTMFCVHVSLLVTLTQTQVTHTNRCLGCCGPALCITG